MPRNPFSMTGRMAKPLPLGLGKSFYVVPSADALEGEAKDYFRTDEDGNARIYTSIADAITDCVSGRGDYIYVMPGTYTLTTALAMSKNDVHLIGIGNNRAILTGSGADVMDLTADGCEIAGFTFNLATTKKVIDMVGADRNWIHDNLFLSSVGGAASHFIHMVTTVCHYNRINGNRFLSNLVVSGGAITQTSHITGLGIGNIIEDNFLMAGRVTTANAGVVTDGIVFAAAADAGNIVRNNILTEFNGATFGEGIDYGTTALAGSVFTAGNNLMLATATDAIAPGTNAATFANNIANGTV